MAQSPIICFTDILSILQKFTSQFVTLHRQLSVNLLVSSFCVVAQLSQETGRLKPKPTYREAILHCHYLEKHVPTNSSFSCVIKFAWLTSFSTPCCALSFIAKFKAEFRFLNVQPFSNLYFAYNAHVNTFDRY